MAWNEQRNLGRYEVIFRDRELHDATEARAKRLGMAVGEYLQLLSRAVLLLEQGDPILASVLGLSSGMPTSSAPLPDQGSPPGAKDASLVDNALDQMGL